MEIRCAFDSREEAIMNLKLYVKKETEIRGGLAMSARETASTVMSKHTGTMKID